MYYVVDGIDNNSQYVVVELGKIINMYIQEKSSQFGKRWHGLHKIKLDYINKYKYYAMEGIDDNNHDKIAT